MTSDDSNKQPESSSLEVQLGVGDSRTQPPLECLPKRRVRRLTQAVSLVILVLGVLIVIEARNFTYMTPMGPGPGFFPLWVGGALAGLSLILLVQASMRRLANVESGELPGRRGVMRVLVIVAAIAMFSVTLERIGFSMAAFLLSFLVMMVLDHKRPVAWLVVAAVLSFGAYLVFRYGLGVNLPGSPLGLSEAIGL